MSGGFLESKGVGELEGSPPVEVARQCAVALGMAVCGVLPLFNMLLMQLDMDSCLGFSLAALQSNLCRLDQRHAPSSCSSTMASPDDQLPNPDSASPPSATANPSSPPHQAQQQQQQEQGEEEGTAPPKKRARTSSSQDSPPSATTTLATAHQTTPQPSRQCTSENEATAAAGTSGSSQKQPWWLSSSPSSSSLHPSPGDTASADVCVQRGAAQQSQQQAAAAAAAAAATATATAQEEEGDFFPKHPVYDPDMLSSMESRQDRASNASAAGPGSGTSTDWADTADLPFFSSSSRHHPQRSSSTASAAHSADDRPASSGHHTKGKEPALVDTPPRQQDLELKSMPPRHPSPFQQLQQRYHTSSSPYTPGGSGSGAGGTGQGMHAGASFYGKLLASMPYDTAPSLPPMFNQPQAHIALSMAGQRHMDVLPPPLFQHSATDMPTTQKLAATATATATAAAAAAAAHPGPAPFLPRFQPPLGYPYPPMDMSHQPAQPHSQQRLLTPGFAPPPPATPPPGMDLPHPAPHSFPPFNFPQEYFRPPASQLPLPRPTAHSFRDFLPSQAPSHGTRFQFPMDRPSQPPQPPALVPLTIILEGREIGGRINLHDFDGYLSFAAHLRATFRNHTPAEHTAPAPCNLSDAIPGYMIAYEDHEGDTLLAGDTSWREFVRLAKRIKILPSKRRPWPTAHP